jgi:hypothetical protein
LFYTLMCNTKYSLENDVHVIDSVRYVLTSGRCLDKQIAAKDLAKMLNDIVKDIHFGITRLVRRRKLWVPDFLYQFIKMPEKS